MRMNRVLKNVGAPAIAIVACAAAVMVSYCGKKDEESKFASVYANSLASCARCHSPERAQYETVELDLSSEEKAYASLMSAMSFPDAPTKCSGFNYVKAGDSANSPLWAVLDNTTREAFPASCPIVSEDVHGMDSLSDENKAAVKAWIDAGAQR